MLSRVVTYLIYLSILLFLALPILNIGLINIGPINIYVFEIPLALSFLLTSIFSLHKKLNKNEYVIIRLYVLTFLPLILIGLFGALNSQERLATILSSSRPILYWLTGLIVILIGHENVKLKTLFWLVISGLLMQFFVGIVFTIFGSDTVLSSSDRFMGRSGFMTLILFAVFYLVSSKSNKNSFYIQSREYNVMMFSTAVLLFFVILVQNRTTWIAMVLLAMYLAFKGRNIKLLLRTSASFVVFLLIFVGLSKVGLIPGEIIGNIERRLVEDTLSKEGAGFSMLARSQIYESSYADFLERPLLGHGFGHQLSFREIWNPNVWATASNMDNSYINYTHKFGLIGLMVFILFLLRIIFLLRRNQQHVKREEAPYYIAFLYSFPLLCIVSLNIDVLYSYPEVIIISLFSAKGLCAASTTRQSRKSINIHSEKECLKLLRSSHET